MTATVLRMYTARLYAQLPPRKSASKVHRFVTAPLLSCCVQMITLDGPGAGYGPGAPPSRRQPGRHRARRPAAGVTAGRDRLYEIDLLRITAALAVVLYHYTFSGYAGHLTSIAFPALSHVTRYGYLGVDMFFTISGFVVLLSAWGRRPHEFVISRIVRLYPAYWVAVTITAIVAITLSRG